MPDRLDEEELPDWRAGRNAVYQLAALTIGRRLAVANPYAKVADIGRDRSIGCARVISPGRLTSVLD
jgi:hypothetical protein